MLKSLKRKAPILLRKENAIIVITEPRMIAITGCHWLAMFSNQSDIDVMNGSRINAVITKAAIVRIIISNHLKMISVPLFLFIE